MALLLIHEHVHRGLELRETQNAAHQNEFRERTGTGGCGTRTWEAVSPPMVDNADSYACFARWAEVNGY
jgi:hypothetical protein